MLTLSFPKFLPLQLILISDSIFKAIKQLIKSHNFHLIQVINYRCFLKDTTLTEIA